MLSQIVAIVQYGVYIYKHVRVRAIGMLITETVMFNLFSVRFMHVAY